MKKILSVAVALLMMLGMLGISASAEPEPGSDLITVYVTISTADGELILTREAIVVGDEDGDDIISIYDVLYTAHEKKYEGGVSAGYNTAETQYGISLIKLWGDTSGAFGYYVNNKSATSLNDVVKDGDYIHAYVYQDQTAWSDSYSWFEKSEQTAKLGESVTLTLFAASYDASWNLVTSPVSGAKLLINGVASSYKTDAEGKVTLNLENSGSFVISATSESQTLVPPVCRVVIESDQPVEDEEPGNTQEGVCGTNTDDGDNEVVGSLFVALLYCVGAVLVIGGFIAAIIWLKKTKK